MRKIENFSDRFEIHAHSYCSNIRLIDCINRPRELILKAHQLGMKGICLTDHEALCGHIEWLLEEKSLKEKELIPQDFKCGLGNEIYLVDDSDNIEKYWHFILIAKNVTGHRALRELSSKAWYNSFYTRGMERVPTEKRELRAIVQKYPRTLIASTACLGGQLAHFISNLVDAEKKQDNEEIIKWKLKIKEFLDFGIELFGEDFYIEIAPAKSKDQLKFNKRVIEIADSLKMKIVFGTDSHYYTSKEREVHKGYLNSKEGEREVDDFYFYSHLMSNKEAFENCKGYMSLEQFNNYCDNSMEILEKIENYDGLFHKPIIPRVNVPFYEKQKYKVAAHPILQKLIDSDNEQERYWINQCLETLEQKKLWNNVYLSRLEEEADILLTISEKMENCMFEYFNTFQHYIDLFWKCGTVVGPGRGSSCCFLSNYLLGIVQIDPIKWELPAFRFLNKERAELPDIDIDLATSKRPKILEKIREERGELNLLQVATFRTESSRSAIKSACRGYRGQKLKNGKWEYPNGIDIDIANYLSSMVPVERGFCWTLDEMVHGNEEKDRKPKKEFVSELEKYPGLLDIMLSIEGIVCGRGQHASGVILYNDSPFETNAIMKSPNGDLTTQFDLHMSELMGDTKFDYLVTEVCDKIITCIELLQEDRLLPKENSLREIYNEYLHPEKIDIENPEIWKAINSNQILDLFQFDSPVGRQGIAQVQPKNITELLMTNALIRLAGEKGKERPMDRYVRLKANLDEWYDEIRARGLSEKEIRVLEPHYKKYYGTPTTQESLMLLCMDKDVANFSLKDANMARKVVAKKNLKAVPLLQEKFINACPTKALGEYVWETCMLPQMSYAFALPHATAYSLVGYQVALLATLYPRIYWNTACLIVNTGGIEENNEILDDEENEEKKKVKATNYGRIASAIGKVKEQGIEVAPPDINRSKYTFSPDAEKQIIRYGLRGIVKVGEDVAKAIVANRPYQSIDDFLSKVKVNKTQMINLIKAGAFDDLGDRVQIMHDYVRRISEPKKRITLQNMKMLIDFKLIPDEFDLQRRVFNFNKYIKKMKLDDIYYGLDDIALAFFDKNFEVDNLEPSDKTQSGLMIKQLTWDKIYKKQMDIIRPWVKENASGLLEKVNQRLEDDIWEKYCLGNLSKWEMDSVSFYSHEHELENVDGRDYECIDFYDLSEEPDIERVITIKGKQVPLYRIYRIMGTVLDKDKNKNSITLLTTSGVINVKIWGDVFVHYDKQISQKNEETGKKKVIEKSWFTRGNKVIVTGIRRNDGFMGKKYSRTPYHLVELITEIHNDGTIETRGERAEVV